MKQPRYFLISFALGIAVLLWGCDADKSAPRAAKYDTQSPIDSFGKPNIDVISVGVTNYTTNFIGGGYILKPEKNNIDEAGNVSGVAATQPDADKWSRSGGSGANLAWDDRSKAPYKFKIWWITVFDKELDKNSGPYAKDGGMFDPYDPYITKETRPGSTWCEYEIEVREVFKEPYGEPFPGRFRDRFSLYFYPDGTVRGHLLFVGEKDDAKNPPIEDIKKRSKLPVLVGKPCLKQIPNPLFGRPKPITIN